MKLLQAIAAFLTIIVLIAGIPWLLLRTVGNPLESWDALLAGDLSSTVLLDVLGALAFVAWAQFAIALMVELISGIQRTPMPRRIPGVFAGQQHLARALVTAALMIVPTLTAVVTPVVAAATPSPTPISTSQVHAVAQGVDQTAAVTHEITVDSPTSWWELAEQHLGSGEQWHQLWDLNRGRVQPDGATLTTAALINPGWTLLLPGPAAPNPTEECETTGGVTSFRPGVTAASAGVTAASAGVTEYEEGKQVLVQVGDSLSQIATDHGISSWAAIWELNHNQPQADGRTFDDPDLIMPGWTLTLPAADSSVVPSTGSASSQVKVQPGDSLSEIAQDQGLDGWHALYELNVGVTQPDGNQLQDPNILQPGWLLTMPDESAPTTTGAPESATATDVSTDEMTTEPSPDDLEQPDAAVTTEATPETSVQPDTSESAPVGPHTAAAAGTTAGGGTSSTTASTSAPSTTSTTATTTAQPTADKPSVAANPDLADTPTNQTSGSAVWGVGALAGFGGLLLSGVALIALQRHRRRKFRNRQPGHTVAASPPDLVGLERDLLVHGSIAANPVKQLDHALRQLADWHQEDSGSRELPDLIAVELDTEQIVLHLRTLVTNTPPGWTADKDGAVWVLNNIRALDSAAPSAGSVSPYPALVSVGYTRQGLQLLLDLEGLGTLGLTGDPDRCLNLARFMTAELAHNTWSDMLEITAAGFGDELADLNPDRLNITDDLASVASALAATRQQAAWSGTPILTGRAGRMTADTYAPHVVLINANNIDDAADLDAVMQEANADIGRSAIAVLTAETGNEEQPGTQQCLHIGADGTLTFDVIQVEECIAQQLTADEGRKLTQLLAAAATTRSAQPEPSPGIHPWDELSDAMGAPLPRLRAETRRPAAVVSLVREPTVASVLPEPDLAYLTETAATAEDLTELAPMIPEQSRRQVLSADPELDHDVADWFDQDCLRPRVSLLGPVTVRAAGSLPPSRPRQAWHTEIIAYLATRPRGVIVEQYGTDLWPGESDIVGKSKLRNSVHIARKWLGVNQQTGTFHLPANTGAPGATYRIEGALIDAELFKRLRIRGTATGADGITDLQTALSLVTGPPFDQRRPGGYSWLAQHPLDHEYTGMIVDVAHLVATHHLANHEPEKACAAAQVALLAGASDDTPLLDMIAACKAQDNNGEADAYLHQILTNHDADVEEDLPPRTYEVLLRRDWLPKAKAN